MGDVLFGVLTVAVLALAVGLVHGCERIIGVDDLEADSEVES